MKYTYHVISARHPKGSKLTKCEVERHLIAVLEAASTRWIGPISKDNVPVNYVKFTVHR
jgi:hypothetical protein